MIRSPDHLGSSIPVDREGGPLSIRSRDHQRRDGGQNRAVPAPVVITDPDDPRVADFRDLKAGDRPEGTPRGTGTVIVEGVPAVERLLASPYRVRAVFGVPGRVAALDLPEDVAAYEADKWLLSEVIGFRLTRGVLASADRRPRPAPAAPPAPPRRSGRAARRPRSRGPAPTGRAGGAQRRGEPGLDRALGT